MDSKAIEDLNVLLKNELAAIATYNQALAKFQDKHGLDILRRCQQSHTERAAKISSAIIKLKGKSITDAGLGAQFAKLVMSGAQAMGDQAIIMALQADESEWSAAYEWCLVSMHGDHRPMVKEELLPQQQETDEKLRELANAATKGLWPATPGTKDI